MEEEYQNTPPAEPVLESDVGEIEEKIAEIPESEPLSVTEETAEETPTVSPSETVPATEELPAESVSAENPIESFAEPVPEEPEEKETKRIPPPPKLKYYDEAEREEEINKYRKFKKVDGDTYRRINQFLRKRTYITAREWAISRLCSDFRTPYGAEMTFIGENLPRLCPFMTEPYSPQAVNQARVAFKKKVRKSAATFLYGAMCGFFTNEELDDILYEANEVARFILEIEGTTLDIDDEIDIEDKISDIMKKLGDSAVEILQNRGVDSDDDDEEEDVVEVVEIEK